MASGGSADSSIPDQGYTVNEVGVGSCFICKVALTSFALTEQHVNGAKHQKKLMQRRQESAMRAESQTKQPISVQQLSTALSNMTMTPATSPMAIKPTVPDMAHHPKPSILPDTEYNVNELGAGRCNICDIELTSAQNTSQHLQGKRHLKNKNVWLMQKSQQKSLSMDTSHSSDSSLDTMSRDTTLSRDPIVSTLGSGLDQRALGSVPNDQSRPAGASSTSVKGLLGQTPPFTQATAPASPIVQPMNEPFLCEDCGIYVNSLEQLRIHKESPKHAKKAGEKRRIETFQCRQQPVTQVPQTAPEHPKSTTQPDPCPYECMICNKKLNTLSQLEIHLKTTASHANLSEEDIKRLLNEGTPVSLAAVRPQIAMMQPKIFTCDLCQTKVCSIEEMAEHVCQKEADSVEMDNTMFKHIV